MIDFQDLKSGKVKLEFGNMEHVKIIDESAEQQRLDAIKDDPEILKKFRCIFYASGSAEIDVDAYDEEEAEEVARDLLGFDDVEWEDWEHHEIQLIGEAEES